MTSWHVEPFKLEEFEKWHVQEGLSNLPLKQVINPLARGSLPIPGGKEHPYHQRKGTKGNLNQQALQVPSSLLHLAHT